MTAEEIEDASTVIPRSMLASVSINGCLGFAMVIATLFCFGDVMDALDSPTGYPFIEVFFNATRSVDGTIAMVCRLWGHSKLNHDCVPEARARLMTSRPLSSMR